MRIVIAEAGVEYRIASDKKVRSPSEAIEQAKDIVTSATECVAVIVLDTKNGMRSCEIVTNGLANASLLHPREVFRRAIALNGASVILVHNHPSGDPMPSADDIRTTRQMVEAGRILDINVLDHVIMAPSPDGTIKHVSLRESGIVTFA